MSFESDYVTLVKPYDGRTGFSTATYYLPRGTAGEQLTRSLAPSIHRKTYELHRANVPDGDLVVLLPASSMDDELRKSIHGGTIMGKLIKVVDGIDEPMLAYPLEVSDI